eukprot:gene10975-7620_t
MTPGYTEADAETEAYVPYQRERRAPDSGYGYKHNGLERGPRQLSHTPPPPQRRGAAGSPSRVPPTPLGTSTSTHSEKHQQRERPPSRRTSSRRDTAPSSYSSHYDKHRAGRQQQQPSASTSLVAAKPQRYADPHETETEDRRPPQTTRTTTRVEKGGLRRPPPRGSSPSALAHPRNPPGVGERRDGSKTQVDGATAAAAAHSMSSSGSRGAAVRVRVHRCRGAFREKYGVAPESDDGYATYVVVYNDLDRGQTSTAPSSLDPVFNEEFFLHTDDPAKDALVVTLIRRVPSSGARHRSRSDSRSPAGATSAASHTIKDQRVGECVLSLESLVWKQEKMIWAPLVRRAGTPEAYEQGEILISLYSEDYGLDVADPPEDEAAGFFREVHRVLLRHAPLEIHRAHWIAGHYERQPHRWERLRDTYEARSAAAEGRGRSRSHHQPKSRGASAAAGASQRQPAPVELTTSPQNSATNRREALRAHTARVGGVRLNILVKEVQELRDDVGRPLHVASSCGVTVASESGLEEALTTAEPYHHRAVFQQDFFVTLQSPEERVRLSVVADKKKVGEATLGLFNMHPRKPTSVVLLLVGPTRYNVAPPPTANTQFRQQGPSGGAAAGDDFVEDVCIAGYLHLVVYTESYASAVQYAPKEAELLQRRVMTYIWYRCRREMYQIHPVMGRLPGVESGMRELATAAGPEPVGTSFLLHFRDCRHLQGPLSRSGATCFVEVHIGPFRQRTHSAVTRSGGHLPLNDTLEVVAYEPYTEPCTILLILEERQRCTEIGRVTFGFGRMQQGMPMRRALHLVTRAVTPQATMQEQEVLFEIEALQPYGWDPQAFQSAQSNADESYYVSRVEGILARQQPAKLHTAPYLVDCTSPGREAELLAFLDCTYGNNIESAPMHVTVLGIKNLHENCRTQVTVKLNGEPILKTKTLAKATQVECTMEDRNDVVVPLFNAVQSCLEVTVDQCGLFGSTTLLGRVEVMLRSLVRGEPNVFWIPFYHEDVVCGKEPTTASTTQVNVIYPNVIPAGFIGVALRCMAFPRLNVVEYPQRKCTPLTPHEEVFRDVTTLLLKTRPRDLPRVQPLIAEYATIDAAHRELRKQLLPFAVAATLYVTVEEINILDEEGREAERAGNVGVRVRCGQEVQTSRQRSEKLKGLPPRLFYPVMRVDVPLLIDCDSAAAADPRHACGGAGGSPSYDNSGRNGGAVRFAKSGGVFGSPMPPPGRRQRHAEEDEAFLREQQQRIAAAATSSSRDNSYGHASTSGAAVNAEPPVPPLMVELVGLKDGRHYDDDPYRPEEHREWGELAAQQRIAATGDGDANRLRTYQLGGKENYGRPLPPAPFHRGALGEAHLSVRAFLIPCLYEMGERVTVPLVATQEIGGRLIAVGEVGTVTLHVVSSAFEAAAYPPALRLDCCAAAAAAPARQQGRGRSASYGPMNSSGVRRSSASSMAFSSPPPLDGDAIHYYEQRIGARLRQLGASSLATYHYLVYEQHVASGHWEQSLCQWMESLRVPRHAPHPHPHLLSTRSVVVEEHTTTGDKPNQTKSKEHESTNVDVGLEPSLPSPLPTIYWDSSLHRYSWCVIQLRSASSLLCFLIFLITLFTYVFALCIYYVVNLGFFSVDLIWLSITKLKRYPFLPLLFTVCSTDCRSRSFIHSIYLFYKSITTSAMPVHPLPGVDSGSAAAVGEEDKSWDSADHFAPPFLASTNPKGLAAALRDSTAHEVSPGGSDGEMGMGHRHEVLTPVLYESPNDSSLLHQTLTTSVNEHPYSSSQTPQQQHRGGDADHGTSAAPPQPSPLYSSEFAAYPMAWLPNSHNSTSISHHLQPAGQPRASTYRSLGGMREPTTISRHSGGGSSIKQRPSRGSAGDVHPLLRPRGSQGNTTLGGPAAPQQQQHTDGSPSSGGTLYGGLGASSVVTDYRDSRLSYLEARFKSMRSPSADANPSFLYNDDYSSGGGGEEDDIETRMGYGQPQPVTTGGSAYHSILARGNPNSGSGGYPRRSAGASGGLAPAPYLNEQHQLVHPGPRLTLPESERPAQAAARALASDAWRRQGSRGGQVAGAGAGGGRHPFAAAGLQHPSGAPTASALASRSRTPTTTTSSISREGPPATGGGAERSTRPAAPAPMPSMPLHRLNPILLRRSDLAAPASGAGAARSRGKRSVSAGTSILGGGGGRRAGSIASSTSSGITTTTSSSGRSGRATPRYQSDPMGRFHLLDPSEIPPTPPIFLHPERHRRGGQRSPVAVAAATGAPRCATEAPERYKAQQTDARHRREAQERKAADRRAQREGRAAVDHSISPPISTSSSTTSSSTDPKTQGKGAAAATARRSCPANPRSRSAPKSSLYSHDDGGGAAAPGPRRSQSASAMQQRRPNNNGIIDGAGEEEDRPVVPPAEDSYRLRLLFHMAAPRLDDSTESSAERSRGGDSARERGNPKIPPPPIPSLFFIIIIYSFSPLTYLNPSGLSFFQESEEENNSKRVTNNHKEVKNKKRKKINKSFGYYEANVSLFRSGLDLPLSLPSSSFFFLHKSSVFLKTTRTDNLTFTRSPSTSLSIASTPFLDSLEAELTLFIYIYIYIYIYSFLLIFLFFVFCFCFFWELILIIISSPYYLLCLVPASFSASCTAVPPINEALIRSFKILQACDYPLYKISPFALALFISSSLISSVSKASSRIYISISQYIYIYILFLLISHSPPPFTSFFNFSLHPLAFFLFFFSSFLVCDIATTKETNRSDTNTHTNKILASQSGMQSYPSDVPTPPPRSQDGELELSSGAATAASAWYQFPAHPLPLPSQQPAQTGSAWPSLFVFPSPTAAAPPPPFEALRPSQTPTHEQQHLFNYYGQQQQQVAPGTDAVCYAPCTAAGPPASALAPRHARQASSLSGSGRGCHQRQSSGGLALRPSSGITPPESPSHVCLSHASSCARSIAPSRQTVGSLPGMLGYGYGEGGPALLQPTSRVTCMFPGNLFAEEPEPEPEPEPLGCTMIMRGDRGYECGAAALQQQAEEALLYPPQDLEGDSCSGSHCVGLDSTQPPPGPAPLSAGGQGAPHSLLCPIASPTAGSSPQPALVGQPTTQPPLALAPYPFDGYRPSYKAQPLHYSPEIPAAPSLPASQLRQEVLHDQAGWIRTTTTTATDEGSVGGSRAQQVAAEAAEAAAANLRRLEDAPRKSAVLHSSSPALLLAGAGGAGGDEEGELHPGASRWIDADGPNNPRKLDRGGEEEEEGSARLYGDGLPGRRLGSLDGAEEEDDRLVAPAPRLSGYFYCSGHGGHGEEEDDPPTQPRRSTRHSCMNDRARMYAPDPTLTLLGGRRSESLIGSFAHLMLGRSPGKPSAVYKKLEPEFEATVGHGPGMGLDGVPGQASWATTIAEAEELSPSPDSQSPSTHDWNHEREPYEGQEGPQHPSASSCRSTFPIYCDIPCGAGVPEEHGVQEVGGGGGQPSYNTAMASPPLQPPRTPERQHPERATHKANPTTTSSRVVGAAAAPRHSRRLGAGPARSRGEKKMGSGIQQQQQQQLLGSTGSRGGPEEDVGVPMPSIGSGGGTHSKWVSQQQQQQLQLQRHRGAARLRSAGNSTSPVVVSTILRRRGSPLPGSQASSSGGGAGPQQCPAPTSGLSLLRDRKRSLRDGGDGEDSDAHRVSPTPSMFAMFSPTASPRQSVSPVVQSPMLGGTPPPPSNLSLSSFTGGSQPLLRLVDDTNRNFYAPSGAGSPVCRSSTPNPPESQPGELRMVSSAGGLAWSASFPAHRPVEPRHKKLRGEPSLLHLLLPQTSSFSSFPFFYWCVLLPADTLVGVEDGDAISFFDIFFFLFFLFWLDCTDIHPFCFIFPLQRVDDGEIPSHLTLDSSNSSSSLYIHTYPLYFLTNASLHWEVIYICLFMEEVMRRVSSCTLPGAIFFFLCGLFTYSSVPLASGTCQRQRERGANPTAKRWPQS